jgi:hypothetical protein
MKIGDKVYKRSGYEYPGYVVSVFVTRSGHTRIVVEHATIVGLLHIFNPEQMDLEP